MKKIFTLFLCLIMGFVGAHAQQAAANAAPNSSALAGRDSLARLKALPPAGQARMVSDILKTKLTLDTAQYHQVSGVALRLAQQMQPIINSDDSRYSKLSRLRPLMQGAEQQLKAILNLDQYNKYLIFKQTLIDQARAARS